LENFKVLTTSLVFSLVGLLLLSPNKVCANDVNSFSTRNLNPFIRIFSWPSALQNQIPIPGNFELGLHYEVGNSCSWDTNGVSEQIYLDGESSWLTLQLNYALTGRYSIGVELPYFRHTAGYLDNTVNVWHHLTGLPQGRRKSVSGRQIQYRYKNKQMEIIKQNTPQFGLGKILLTGAVQLLQKKSGAVALHGGYSIPAFSVQTQLHSTSSDISMHLSSTRNVDLFNLQSVLFTSIGFILPGRVEKLTSIQRHRVLIGRICGIANLSRDIAIKCQFDFNSPFYKSAMDQIGVWAGQLIIGGTVQLKKGGTVNFGITEDNVVSTAPDFGFIIGIDQVILIK